MDLYQFEDKTIAKMGILPKCKLSHEITNIAIKVIVELLFVLPFCLYCTSLRKIGCTLVEASIAPRKRKRTRDFSNQSK